MVQLFRRAAWAAIFLTGWAAAAQAACPVHVVQRGDTLRKIAERYLGARDLSVQIYRANTGVVGPNPDVIEIGMRLRIPCGTPGRAAAPAAAPAPSAPEPEFDAANAPQGAPRGGPRPAVLAAANPTVEAEVEGEPAPEPAPIGLDAIDLAEIDAAEIVVTAAPAAASDAPVLHIVAGGPLAPFVDPDDPDGGLIPALARAALLAEPGPPVRIGFVNDRPAHLTEVLPYGDQALSLPWIYPDCGAAPADDTAARLCAGFMASEALYELVTEHFTAADGPYSGARTLGDLAGARLCRPAGYPVYDLAAAGLLPDGLTLIRQPTPRDCLAALDAGAVDVAALDALVARALAIDMGLTQPLLVLEELTRIDGLRAVARRGDPEGQAALRRLDTGLRKIAESGIWFSLVEEKITGR